LQAQHPAHLGSTVGFFVAETGHNPAVGA